MERGRVRHGLLLPRPGTRLHRQDGDVQELRDPEEGGAPERWIGGRILRKIPRRARRDQEEVVAVPPAPDPGVVCGEGGVQIESVLGGEVEVRGGVEIGEGREGSVVRDEDGGG